MNIGVFFTGGSFLPTMKDSFSFKRQGMARNAKPEVTYFQLSLSIFDTVLKISPIK